MDQLLTNFWCCKMSVKPLNVLRSRLLKCKLNLIKESLKLMPKERNNKKLLMLKIVTTLLVNSKDLWMLKLVWRDWPPVSLLNLTSTRLPLWPKSSEFQWLQNLCSSEITRPSQMLLLKSPSEWAKAKMKFLLLSELSECEKVVPSTIILITIFPRCKKLTINLYWFWIIRQYPTLALIVPTVNMSVNW